MMLKKLSMEAQSLHSQIESQEAVLLGLKAEYEKKIDLLTAKAYLAKELVEGEHLSWDIALELAERYEDPWDEVLWTEWAFRQGSLVDEGEPLSTSTLLRLARLAGGYEHNREGNIRALMDLNEAQLLGKPEEGSDEA